MNTYVHNQHLDWIKLNWCISFVQYLPFLNMKKKSSLLKFYHIHQPLTVILWSGSSSSDRIREQPKILLQLPWDAPVLQWGCDHHHLGPQVMELEWKRWTSWVIGMEKMNILGNEDGKWWTSWIMGMEIWTYWGIGMEKWTSWVIKMEKWTSWGIGMEKWTSWGC